MFYALELDVTHFCDTTNNVLQRTSCLPLGRLITTANNRYSKLPTYTRICSNLPFWSTPAESQAGIQAKIGLQPVPFLFVCLMGLLDEQTYDEALV